MKHLGDITKIDGHKVPITDVVIGGSPCQDLSVAGKRAGLDGERSGLFMEQIRVIKEMRDEDRRNGRTDVFVRPRYMVWENVPGALSSPGGERKGEDFRAVLEETARVADPNATIPRPKDGKWTTSGCILGNGWSIAWRILDLQFWGATYFDDEGVPTKLGTPQRRRRIALVADFNGGSAGQILFESYSSTGNLAESGNEGQGTPGDTEESIAESGISFQERAGKPGGGYVPMVVEGADLYNQSTTGEVAKTLNSIKSDSDHVPCVISASKASFFTKTTNNIASVLVATDYKDPPIVVDDSALSLESHPNDSRMGIDPQGRTPILNVEDNQMEDNNYRVRRLTPTECERLQGFPDGWTDIGEWTDSKGKVRQTTDSARYKALGNSIGLPPWKWVLKRISAQYERDATMASLFDGIAGFPFLWEQLNGRGSCLWASEIEEFCIAVTEKRINGKDTVDLRNP